MYYDTETKISQLIEYDNISDNHIIKVREADADILKSHWYSVK